MFAGNAGRAIFQAEHSEMISAFYRFPLFTISPPGPPSARLRFILEPFPPSVLPSMIGSHAGPRFPASADHRRRAGPSIFPELTPPGLVPSSDHRQQITDSKRNRNGNEHNQQTRQQITGPPSVLPWSRPSFPSFPGFLPSLPHRVTDHRQPARHPDRSYIPLLSYYTTISSFSSLYSIGGWLALLRHSDGSRAGPGPVLKTNICS